jgi:hypothetical protein
MLNDPVLMSSIFHALVHAALTTAALAQILLIWAVIWEFSPRRSEIIMRSAGAVSGLLLYLGAKALGLSIPAFMLSALTQATTYTTGVIGALLPLGAGFLVAWYVCGYFSSRDQRKNVVGMRVLALIMVIVWFLFVDTYVATFDSLHQDGFKLLLPNLTFTLALLLYSVFRYHPPAVD